MAYNISQSDCLDMIEGGDIDAYGLLMQHLPSAEKKFKKIDKALIDLITEIRNIFPDAAYYTASGGFHLMLGESHGGSSGMKAQSQLVALSGSAEIGDGDF